MSRTPYYQRDQSQTQRSNPLHQSDFELFEGMNSQISRTSTNGSQNGAQNDSQFLDCVAHCRSQRFNSIQEMQDCFFRCASLRPQPTPNGNRTSSAQNSPGRVGVAGTSNGAPVQTTQAVRAQVPIVNPNAPDIVNPPQTPQDNRNDSAAKLSNYDSRLQFPTNIDWDCVKNCDERARRNEFDSLDALLICLDPCNPQPGSPLVPEYDKSQSVGSTNTYIDVIRKGIQRACSNAYGNNLNDYNNCVSDASKFVEPLIQELESQPTQDHQNGGTNGKQNGVQAIPTRASANGLNNDDMNWARNGSKNGANDTLNMAAQRGCAEAFPNDQNSYNACISAVQNAFRYANRSTPNSSVQGPLKAIRNRIKFLSPTQVSDELARSQNPPTISTSDYQNKVNECLSAGLPIEQCDHYAFLPAFDIRIETRPGITTTTVTPIIPNKSSTNSNGNAPPCQNCPPSQNVTSSPWW